MEDSTPVPGPDLPPTRPVILFDGVCNLCNRSVRFVIDRDPEARFLFAHLQSGFAAGLLASLDGPADLTTVILVEEGRLYTRSTAALRIARGLSGPWRLAYVLIAVPRPIRDAVYGWIARNRYRWFGRTEACRIPTPDEAARFIDDGTAAS